MNHPPTYNIHILGFHIQIFVVRCWADYRDMWLEYIRLCGNIHLLIQGKLCIPWKNIKIFSLFYLLFLFKMKEPPLIGGQEVGNNYQYCAAYFLYSARPPDPDQEFYFSSEQQKRHIMGAPLLNIPMLI